MFKYEKTLQEQIDEQKMLREKDIRDWSKWINDITKELEKINNRIANIELNNNAKK